MSTDREPTIGIDADVRARQRVALSLVGVLVAALLFAFSVPAIWLARMVADTEYYVATVAPLAGDADIQDALADKASTTIISKLDVTGRLRQTLPSALDGIAAPVGTAVDDVVTKQTLAFVRSDRFASTWVAANRTGHAAFAAAVTGRDRGGAVGIQAGTVSLDLTAVADEVKSRLVNSGFGIVADVPTSGLSDHVVLFHSDVLANATTVIRGIIDAAYWLPALAALLAVAGVAVAADRRRAMVWLGGGIAVAGVLPLNAIYVGQYYGTARVAELASISAPAARAAVDIVFRDLVTADRLLALLGLLLWAGAVTLGPSRWAVATRSWLSGGIRGAAAQLDLGPFGTWVATRRATLRSAGLVVAVGLLAVLPPPRTLTQLVWLGVFLLAWLFAVEVVSASAAVKEATDE
jgi:hypothetical protein